MTRARHARVRHSEGFSLIELMISLAIGLIIAGAAFAAYMGTAGASRMAEAQGRMNEDAQAALTILTQQLRMAGNNPAQANRVDNAQPTLSSRHNPVYLPQPSYDGYTLAPASFTLSGFSVRGCDARFSNLAGAARLDDLICPAGAGPHAIAISYEADRFNTVPTEAGLPSDCAGNALSLVTATLPVIAGAASASSAAQYAVADNRFYIAPLAGIPSLYCQGNGAAPPQALVENIEDLRFTYGVVSTATTASTATVAGYLSANDIATQADLAALPDDAARWAKVITVRLCVLVRSEAVVVADAASARYLKCDGTLETAPPDLRLRRAYSSTVVLRNRRL
jgi:type IV pilus assembly protein PilW